MSQVAIITGGSTGIGKALAGALVARGDNVVLAARTEADVHRAADELAARGPGRAWGAVLDVRDASAVAELVESVHRDHGRLDLMVNNAGIAAGGLIEEMSLGYWDALYEAIASSYVEGRSCPGRRSAQATGVAGVRSRCPGAGGARCCDTKSHVVSELVMEARRMSKT